MSLQSLCFVSVLLLSGSYAQAQVLNKLHLLLQRGDELRCLSLYTELANYMDSEIPVAVMFI